MVRPARGGGVPRVQAPMITSRKVREVYHSALYLDGARASRDKLSSRVLSEGG